MFEESVVVQSAVSAFNNAALVSPAFLWYGILAVPVFVLVYFCGNAFLERIGWNRENMLNRASMSVCVLTFVWLILFGGNYPVLRDQTSVLPFLTASIMFLISLFVSSHMRNVQIPRWRDLSRRMKWTAGGVVMLVLGALILSDMHAWWGPLLQVCAFLFGGVLGRRARSDMPAVAGTIIIMTLCVIAILMQPEFFRFGQLGNLTVLHLLGLLAFGILAVMTIVVRNVVPSGRIQRGVFVKCKWLLRFVALLGGALFFLTESVPVFIGIMCAVGAICAISVWHADKLPDQMANRYWALTLVAFGIITTMPAVSCLGILYWTMLPRVKFWAESKALL